MTQDLLIPTLPPPLHEEGAAHDEEDEHHDDNDSHEAETVETAAADLDENDGDNDNDNNSHSQEVDNSNTDETTSAEDANDNDESPQNNDNDEFTVVTLSIPPGKLGVRLKLLRVDSTTSSHGSQARRALITKIAPSCPFKKQIRIGDTLLSVNNQPIQSLKDLQANQNAPRQIELRTKKRGKVGRPRGSTSAKRAKPTVHDPATDSSGIRCSEKYSRYLHKKGADPKLGEAHATLGRVKERRDEKERRVAEQREEVRRLRAALAEAEARVAEGERSLEGEEESYKLALEAVSELELRRPCPWNDHYNELVAYRERHGNIALPTRCKDELDKLCIWLTRQKAQYKRCQHGELRNERPWRIAALEKLGIVWEVKGTAWEKYFKELLAYKAEHGHCMVPTRNNDRYKDLGSWVTVQREESRKFKEGKKSTTNQRRVDRLQEIGFVWNVQNFQWRQMYDRLKAFREEEGHADVPAVWPDDPSLSTWVVRQRKEYEKYHDPDVDHERDSLGRLRSTRMTEERMELLNDIGLRWSTERARSASYDA